MIHTIENDYLRVSVDDHGAELCIILRITIVLMESNIPPVSMGLPGTANLPAWI